MTSEQAALIEEHGPRVRRILIAWARSVPQHCQEDAIQDGMVGLVKAAETYQADRGTSFASYATTRAIGEAIDGLRRLDHLTRSERQRHNAGDIHPGDAGPISIELGSSQVSGDDVPISETLASPTPGPAEEAEQHDQSARLYRAIRRLPPRDRHVIIEVDLRHRKQRAVADELGVTESRVSQMRTRAYQRMRPFLKDAA